MTESDEIVWEALRRECASVRQHLGIGATALGRASFDGIEWYAQAFFALSVGFERAAKLALTLDAAISNRGKFLGRNELRDHGHNIDRLLKRVDEVCRDRNVIEVGLPNSETHRAIVQILTNFASNIGRYYNLEVLDADIDGRDDPIAAWYSRVTHAVLKAHYTDQKRARDEAKTAEFAAAVDGAVVVLATAETGARIREVKEVMRRRAEAKFAREWERMYVLQLARFVTGAVGKLASSAQDCGLYVPFLNEYFYESQLDDRAFRQRKTWPGR